MVNINHESNNPRKNIPDPLKSQRKSDISQLHFSLSVEKTNKISIEEPQDIP